MSRKRKRAGKRADGSQQPPAPSRQQAPGSASRQAAAESAAPDLGQAPGLLQRLQAAIASLGQACLAFLQRPQCAIAAFALLGLALLAYLHVDLTGHDYGYFLPKMLDTQLFYLTNGLALQEYTAGLCAGIFQFANPQSMALSLPQGLSYAFGPAFAMPATYVIMAALAGWGTYLCARFWGLAALPACFAALAFAFNGFLLARMAVGHLAFHGFGLAPILAATLLHGLGSLRAGSLGRALMLGSLASLLLAALLYWGIGVAIVHTLGVTTLMLLICGAFRNTTAGAASNNNPPSAAAASNHPPPSAAAASNNYSPRRGGVRQSCLQGRFAPAAGAIGAWGGSATALLSQDWLRRLIYCALCLAVGLIAAAPKIEAVLAMNANLPRDFYPLPGFSFISLPGLWLDSLFLIPGEAAVNAALQNKQFALGWHESYYSFTPLVLLLLVAALAIGCLRLRSQGSQRRLPYHNLKAQPVVAALVATALVLALALNLYQPHWNQLLKALPLIGQFSGMTRFFAFFIPVVALLLGWALSQWRRLPAWTALAFVAGLTFLQYHALEGNLRSAMYYDRVALAPVLQAWPSNADDIPKISQIAAKTERQPDGSRVPVHAPYDDHLLIEGKSNAQCYEPLFGYRLEQYRYPPLRPGAIDQADADGNLNLKNPACYVYPAENNCQPGDHFKASQRDAMLALVRYDDPGLAVSPARQAANWLGVLTLILLGGHLALYGALSAGRALARLNNPPNTESANAP